MKLDVSHLLRPYISRIESVQQLSYLVVTVDIYLGIRHITNQNRNKIVLFFIRRIKKDSERT